MDLDGKEKKPQKSHFLETFNFRYKTMPDASTATNHKPLDRAYILSFCPIIYGHNVKRKSVFIDNT